LTSTTEPTEHHVRVGDIDLAYLAVGGSGPLAVCLHGFPDTAHTWTHLLPALADAGFRAVAPWLRGYAPSGLDPNDHYQIGASVADVVAMHEALAACSPHLLSHGGHAMAGGLKIQASAVPAFTEAFVAHANNSLSGSSQRARLRIDGEVDLHELDETTVTALLRLGPFGEGNPKPLLATDWVDLADDPRCVGKSGEHLQLSVRQNGALLKGIAFGAAERATDLKDHRRCRLAFEPIINAFNGRRRVELQVVDFKFPGDA